MAQAAICQEDYQAANVADGARRPGRQLGGQARARPGQRHGRAGRWPWPAQGADVVGLDYNPAYCRIARLRGRRYGLTLPLLVGAGEQLPFPAAGFDGVINLDVLEHVADPERVAGRDRAACCGPAAPA